MTKIEQCYDCVPAGCKIGKVLSEINKAVPDKISADDAKDTARFIIEAAIERQQPCPTIINLQKPQNSSTQA